MAGMTSAPSARLHGKQQAFRTARAPPCGFFRPRPRPRMTGATSAPRTRTGACICTPSHHTWQLRTRRHSAPRGRGARAARTGISPALREWGLPARAPSPHYAPAQHRPSSPPPAALHGFIFLRQTARRHVGDCRPHAPPRVSATRTACAPHSESSNASAPVPATRRQLTRTRYPPQVTKTEPPVCTDGSFHIRFSLTEQVSDHIEESLEELGYSLEESCDSA